MKRSQLIFVAAVFTAVLIGILVEWSKSEEHFELTELTAPRVIELDALAPPLGEEELRGRVRTHEGEPAAGVVVHLSPAESGPAGAPPLHWTASAADGSFAILGLPAGAYRALLLQPAHPARELQVEVPTGEVEWSLPEPFPPVDPLPDLVRAPVSGRLLPAIAGEDGALEPYEVVFRPEEGLDPLSGAVQRRVRTDAAGAFRLPDLVVAPYRVEVLPLWAAGGSWPVLGTLELPHRSPGRGDVLVELRCGEIGGRVIDAEHRPVHGALIDLRREEQGARIWPAHFSDEDGRFLVRDMPVGRYLLRILAGAAVHSEVVEVELGSSHELRLPPLSTHAPAGGEE